MRRVFWVVLALALVASGPLWVGEDSNACAATNVGGYLGPNFRMIDRGEDNAANLGFGMAFNRFAFTGETEVGSIVKNAAWRFEAELSDPQKIVLQWGYIQPKFNDMVSFKFGHVKKAFSREVLHPTDKLLTVDRHVGSKLRDLGYADFDYGLELHLAHKMFKVQAGAYSGMGGTAKVDDQDPGLDFGARAIVMPTPGLEIGANAMMVSLPGGYGYYDDNDDFQWGAPEEGSADWEFVPNAGTYPDDKNLYQTNSGLAFGADADYYKEFGTMSLRAQLEFGTGDNYSEGPVAKDMKEDDTWEDYSWYQFQYYSMKVLFMATKQFGIHLGYSMWDPNTSGDEWAANPDYKIGENNETTLITPGIVYCWSKSLRTQVEVQMQTKKLHKLDDQDNWVDDDTRTNFVLQQVMSW